MNYLVERKYMLSLINPYERNLFLDMEQITVDNINNVLKSANVFENKNYTERENTIRRIAFMIVNPQYQYNKINIIDNSIEIETKESFMASVFSDVDKINITINNVNKEDVFNYFDINNIELIESEENTVSLILQNKFNWNEIPVMQDQIWSNKDLIVNLLSKNKNDQTIEQIYKNTDKKLWNDDVLLLDLLNVFPSFLGKAPEGFVYNPMLIELAKVNNTVLIQLTKHLYNNKSHYYYENDVSSSLESKLENEKNKIIKDINIVKYYEDLLNSEKRTLQKYEKEILTNKNLVLFLVSNSNLYKYIYPCLNVEFKKDKEVLEKILKNGETNNIKGLLSEDILKDESILKKYIKTTLKNYADIKKHTYLYSPWINDKEKIKEYASLIEMPKNHSMYHFSCFLEILPKNLKKDPEIINIFIEKNPNLYNKLSESLRNNKTILMNYINGDNRIKIDYIENKIPDEVLLTLNDEEKSQLLRKIPSIVLRNEETKKWIKKPELISNLGKILGTIFSEIDHDYWQQICKSEAICTSLLIDNINNYKLLTPSAQCNHEIALRYLTSESDLDLSKSLPKQIWCSVDFCLKIIKRRRNYVHNFPEEIWSNSHFILGLANFIDGVQEDFSYLWNSGPKKINEILHFYNVERGNYESFLSSYMNKTILNKKLNIKEKKKSNKI